MIELSEPRPARSYRGVPPEERVRIRRAALLDAALDEVLAVGVAAVTVERVCAGAELTKRYFYESFPDRDALLIAAVEELNTGIWDRVTQSLITATSREDRLRAAVTALIDYLTEDTRRARLYVECAALPALQARKSEAIRRFTELSVRELMPASGTLTRKQQRLAARLLVAGTTDIVTAWLDGEFKASRKDLLTVATRIALAGVPEA